MKQNLTLATIVILAVIIGGIFAFDQFRPQEGGNATLPSPISRSDQKVSSQEPTPPRPSGRVDDVIQALLLDASVDEADFAEAQTDIELIGSEQTILGDFWQSYNENEL